MPENDRPPWIDEIADDVDLGDDQRVGTVTSRQSAPRPMLSVLDAVALIVGVVVGVGIFKTPALVATHAGDADLFLLAWLLGGVISLTTAKVLGVLSIVVAGLLIAAPPTPDVTAEAPPRSAFGPAMIFVLLTYGGWNEAAYI
jgi:hypothetical protein